MIAKINFNDVHPRPNKTNAIEVNAGSLTGFVDVAQIERESREAVGEFINSEIEESAFFLDAECGISYLLGEFGVVASIPLSKLIANYVDSNSPEDSLKIAEALESMAGQVKDHVQTSGKV